MPIHNGYTQINNTLLLALLQLPKRQTLVFGCLRINSDYQTHLSKPMSIKDIAEFTNLKRPHVNNSLNTLEAKGWITKVDKKGYAYQWELSIARLTNEQVYAFLNPSETDTQTEIEFEQQQELDPKPEVQPVDRFQLETVDGKQVKILLLGPRAYRFNDTISDFETKPSWKEGDDGWELANGHSAYLSDSDKLELQSNAC